FFECTRIARGVTQHQLRVGIQLLHRRHSTPDGSIATCFNAATAFGVLGGQSSS
ncbi:MAG: hypothetical protein HW417_2042, partial [Steroidobacteraceae bacterium]|nr:hypothetical protein [Steroidobacteraceae bacterium]